MNDSVTHTIHSHAHHFGWDRSNEPALTISSGDTVEMQIVDASGGQLEADSTVADIASLDFERINPVTGPIWVEGAEPGDALVITIDSFRPSSFGWTANIPGFGLLADQFDEPALHVWSLETGLAVPAAFGKTARVPLKPMVGTIGVAPGLPGLHSIVPPRRVGGNMDIRDLSIGTRLYLPVEVPGALLSAGDTHAAQGDGEICGTAIECAMDVALEVQLEKGLDLAYPAFETQGPVSRHLDQKGYHVATGIGEDLFQGARDAVSGTIDWLGRVHGVDPLDAYLLCSVCGDLRISEIVDQPNWVVSFYFPKIVLE
jgi:formamidase